MTIVVVWVRGRRLECLLPIGHRNAEHIDQGVNLGFDVIIHSCMTNR